MREIHACVAGDPDRGEPKYLFVVSVGHVIQSGEQLPALIEAICARQIKPDIVAQCRDCRSTEILPAADIVEVRVH